MKTINEIKKDIEENKEDLIDAIIAQVQELSNKHNVKIKIHGKEEFYLDAEDEPDDLYDRLSELDEIVQEQQLYFPKLTIITPNK